MLFLLKYFERPIVEADTGIFCSIPQTNVFLTLKIYYDSSECFKEGLPGQNLKKTEFLPIFGAIFEVFLVI